MLEFSVSNQLLSRLDSAEVMSGSQNYLNCRFQFSEDWEGLKKVAVFGHGEVDEPIGVELEEDACAVPHEVIKPYGFQLALYGSGGAEGGGYTHVPTNVVTVEVNRSGEEEELDAEPTKTLYDSVMVKLQQVQETTDGAKVSAAANAAQAEEAAQRAIEAEETATEAREVSEEKALSAAGSAKAAEKQKAAAEKAAAGSGEAAVAARQMAVLSREYATGGMTDKGEYIPAKTLLEVQKLDFTSGPVSQYTAELEKWKLYQIQHDGKKYEGVSRVVLEEGSLAEKDVVSDIVIGDGAEPEETGAAGKRVIALEAGGVKLCYTKVVTEEGKTSETLVLEGEGIMANFRLISPQTQSAKFWADDSYYWWEWTNELYEETEDYRNEARKYAKNAEVAAESIADHAGDSAVHVTAEEKEAWNALVKRVEEMEEKWKAAEESAVEKREE